jgi:hypothetical protein
MTGVKKPNSTQIPTSTELFVAGGQSDTLLAYSTDGITWSSNALFIVGYAFAYNILQNLWVVGGTGTNSLAYSKDGYTWTGLRAKIFNSVFAVACNTTNNVWVAGGNCEWWKYFGLFERRNYVDRFRKNCIY